MLSVDTDHLSQYLPSAVWPSQQPGKIIIVSELKMSMSAIRLGTLDSGREEKFIIIPLSLSVGPDIAAEICRKTMGTPYYTSEREGEVLSKPLDIVLVLTSVMTSLTLS